MAKVAMYCGQLILLVMTICCPAAVQAEPVDPYYNMTNGFVDVIQPESRFGGTNFLGRPER